MKYNLAVFDLDGTLLNTLGDLTDALNFALRAEGFKPRTKEEVRGFVGNGISMLIQRAVPIDCPKESLERVRLKFTEYYSTHCADNTFPYSGVLKTLCELKRNGVHIAVVSNKADYAVQHLVKKNFGDIIDYAAGEMGNIPLKPAPDLLYKVISRFGATNENTIYIGDSEVDIQTAKNAGLDHISVSWGFKSREQLERAGALIIVQDAEELVKIITEQ